jgi:hypothetical protein
MSDVSEDSLADAADAYWDEMCTGLDYILWLRRLIEETLEELNLT